MSRLRSQLATQLSRYDEDAFAALANKGLLRRALKDLEKTPVTEADVQALGPDEAAGPGPALLIHTGGQQVRLDARGPAQAVCGCPASGVCQHILAAAIGLQRLGAGGDGGGDAASGSTLPADPSSAPDAGSSRSAPTATDTTRAAPAPAPATATTATGLPSSPPPLAPSVAGTIAEQTGEADDQPLDDLRQALLALPTDVLVRHAGKPGYRWAWQFVQDLSLERDFRVDGDRYLVLGFARPRVAFRYMGGGLDSLIIDTELPQPNKYRVAAVLALRLALGLAVAEPEAPKRRAARAAALDLGLDHALPPEAGTAQEASRARLMFSTRQLLAECLRLGLSHLSKGIQERLSTLAVWAQGAECHRLSRLLRRLADHVELLLARAGGADEHRLMDELAIGHALVDALARAAARGHVPVALVGRARTRYEGAGHLTLLGLGASPWRSASGYAGLTMIFWSPQERSFLSCTDARPASMRNFDPVARYAAPGPWRGLSSPAQASGRRVVLTGAQLNEQGRLSAAESTHAMVDDAGSHAAAVGSASEADALIAQLPVDEDWAALSRRYQADQRSLLAEPRPMADWAVLRPARCGPAVFQAERQTQVWPLFDAENRRLDAELIYQPRSAAAIERIEQLHELAPHTLVVGRLRPGASGLVIEPLSLITPTPGPSGRRVDALYFDPSPRGERLVTPQEVTGQRRRVTPTAAMPVAPVVMPSVLRDLRVWLCRQAERGVPVEQWPRWRTEAAAWADRAMGHGFSLFGRALPADVEVPVLMLRWHYLLMQCERLAGSQGHGGQEGDEAREVGEGGEGGVGGEGVDDVDVNDDARA
ncbi:hypothetical protein [Roseateles amylovorans]|uniref:SWIM-type domain-containing protein n=1 Tax=Roseateles amylovorans TaxID=2978473 RepID=A0ABY6B331_9BURK|nr:hypothetical protein [Roseateles amylovorans]UXH79585.1 hypothetical protein N4261_06605 [Roseateles amylovorans]